MQMSTIAICMCLNPQVHMHDKRYLSLWRAKRIRKQYLLCWTGEQVRGVEATKHPLPLLNTLMLMTKWQMKENDNTIWGNQSLLTHFDPDLCICACVPLCFQDHMQYSTVVSQLFSVPQRTQALWRSSASALLFAGGSLECGTQRSKVESLRMCPYRSIGTQPFPICLCFRVLSL